MKRKTFAGILSVLALAISAPTAIAVGGPNEAGNSGKFHPHSNPCQSDADQPHCPGPA
jgi:hypothetical protein